MRARVQQPANRRVSSAAANNNGSQYQTPSHLREWPARTRVRATVQRRLGSSLRSPEQAASVTFFHKFNFQIPGNCILETSGSFRIQIPAHSLILETSGSFRIQIPARRLILETRRSFRIQIPARSGNSRKFQNPVSSSWSVSGNKA